jgi:hypothetical protein
MPLLTPPPTPAIQRGDRSTFANRLDAFITWLINFVTEMLALVSSLNILAAGGAYTIPYMVDLSTTADGDPTPGRLRLNAGTQNAATTIYLDLLGLDGIDYTSTLDQLDASTSAVKGQIQIVKQGDASKFLTFNVTARTTAAGYRKLSVSNTGGSSANPFGANESVLIKFTRTGDKGDAGSLTQVLWVTDEKPSGTPGGDGAPGTYVVRTLNTIKKNSISGASLASNQITLPAGTYRAKASAIATVNAHRLYLHNVTDNIAVALGGTQASGSGNTASTIAESEFVLAATKVFELRHWISTNITSTGLGSMSSSGMAEVYAQVFIEKAS